MSLSHQVLGAVAAGVTAVAVAACGGSGNPSGAASASGAKRAAPAPPAKSVELVVKSDEEKAVKGQDGKYHDAFIPASFRVSAGQKVTVTVSNYDDTPHTFTSPQLGVNKMIPGGHANAPSKTTFTFTAPRAGGKYLWWCATPCDPYSMAHIGLMRGYVTVAA